MVLSRPSEEPQPSRAGLTLRSCWNGLGNIPVCVTPATDYSWTVYEKCSETSLIGESYIWQFRLSLISWLWQETLQHSYRYFPSIVSLSLFHCPSIGVEEHAEYRIDESSNDGIHYMQAWIFFVPKSAITSRTMRSPESNPKQAQKSLRNTR